MKKNYGIEFLRLIMLMQIFLYHYTTRISELFSVNFPFNVGEGVVPVFCFFLLSGFFVSNIFNKNWGGVSFNKLIDMILARYYRFFPTYIISIIIIYLSIILFGLPGREVGFGSFLLNFSIIHPGVPFVDGAHWFLSDLLLVTFFCYFLLLSKKTHAVLISLLCVSAIVLPICLFFKKSVFESSFPPFFIGLIIGCAHIGRLPKWCFFLSSAVCILYAIYYQSIIMIVYLLSFIFLLLMNLNNTIIGKIGFKFGKYFLPWYLIHQNIGFIIILFCCRFSHNEILLVLPIVFTLLLAILISKLAAFFPSYESLKNKLCLIFH